jgi:riboflavin transporter FmnP
MKTKTISLIIAFSAIVIVLNPTISRLAIPVLYLPNVVYQFFEIPIMIALFLLGFRSGLVVAVLNSIAMVFLFPGSFYLYPVVNLAAVTSMMIGISLAIGFYKGRVENQEIFRGKRIILISTAFGIILRILVTTPIWYGIVVTFYPNPSFAFFSTVIFPLQALYNSTQALFTIPIAYFIAKRVSRNLRIDNQDPRKTLNN